MCVCVYVGVCVHVSVSVGIDKGKMDSSGSISGGETQLVVLDVGYMLCVYVYVNVCVCHVGVCVQLN